MTARAGGDLGSGAPEKPFMGRRVYSLSRQEDGPLSTQLDEEERKLAAIK